MIEAVPLSLAEANEYVDKYHRHHAHVKRDKYRVAAAIDGKIVGIVQVGNPVSRILCDGFTLEVVRLCTDGTKDVCSFLYAKAARIAKELGYKKIITYIFENESGASLVASGWHQEAASTGGNSWNTPSRPREIISSQLSLFEQKPKYPTEKKQRWAKLL